MSIDKLNELKRQVLDGKLSLKDYHAETEKAGGIEKA